MLCSAGFEEKFAFELLKRGDGLFAMSSSPLAQLGIRWLVFAIPESLLEKFEVKLLMLVGENMAAINSKQNARHSNSRTEELKAKRERRHFD